MKWWQEAIVWAILAVVGAIVYTALIEALALDSEQRQWFKAAISCVIVLGILARQRWRGR